VGEQRCLLITTAIEDTWDCSLPVVFLGEWCRMYGRQSVWKNMDAEVVPFHWNDRLKLKHDYDYLCELYERVLPPLANHLNEIHGVNYSLRYWRILVGPWLAYFIHILFDRWESIQQAVKDYSITETIILTWPKETMVPTSMEHFFSELMAGPEWNHSIFAYIIENFTAVKCVKKVSIRPFVGFREKITDRKNISLKRRIFTAYCKIAAHFVKNKDIFLIATYLSAFDELKLFLRFRQMPQRWSTIPPVVCAVDCQKRKWTFELPEESSFVKCLSTLIPMQIPAVYLEGYNKIIEQTKTLPWPKSPRLIFTSNVLWHDTVSMAYSAWHIEKGAKLVYGQHGGFGLPQFIWSEKHEREISDRYLTWGWTERGSTNLVPVGIIKPISKYKSRGSATNNRLLLVRGLWPPYIYRLDSGVGLPQLMATIDGCIKLARLLPENLRNNSLIVRLYPLANAFSSEGRKADRSATDFYCEELRWRSALPDVHLNDGTDPIVNLVAQSRLVIYTYNGGTGYLEFMAADVPVIAFWDMIESPVRDSAVPYFEDLKRVGIFHETPESAAAHIAEIWEDVEGWWKSTKVQEVLVRFKARYCHQPENLLDQIETALRDIIVK
jgi:putative transferase (TIGR04331 family)